MGAVGSEGDPGIQLGRRLSDALVARLPEGWTMSQVDEVAMASDARPDLVLGVEAPDGRAGRVIVELKTVVEGRDVPALQEQLDAFTSLLGGRGLVAARYLSPPTRARLEERGISYIDSTGNMNVRLDEPALFIADRGADKDPGRGRGRPRGTLAGAPAAGVVRAITDIDRDWSMRDLIDVSGVSTGAAYRVVDFLDSEGLVERPRRGAVSVPSWVDVLRRWSQDYGFARDNQVTSWIAVRGLPDLLTRAAAFDPSGYAVTGSFAAARWAEHAPARAAMIYVKDAEKVADAWGLRPAQTGANVLLAEPTSRVPFVRTQTAPGGLIVAAPAQVVVDLLTGPGRNPSEGEELLTWMTRNEGEWRDRG